MSAYDVLKKQKYLDYSIEWANANDWNFNRNENHNTTNADNVSCGETYMDLMTKYGVEGKMTHMLETLEFTAQDEKNDYWWWIDTNIRKDLPVSRPIYPSGLHKINSRELVSLGLLTEEILRLAVWNVNAGKDNEISIDLSKWLYSESQILDMYPPIKDIKYELCGTELFVKLPTKNSALYLEIKRC